MSTRDDAIFLAGFITGTYDLKGEALPPKCIQQVIECIMATPVLSAEPAPLVPVATAHLGVATEFSSPEDTVDRIKKVVAAMPEDDARPPEPLPDDQHLLKPTRKKVELSPEEAERRRQRMKDMWARKKAQTENESSIPAITSMVVTGEQYEKLGNLPAPSAGGA